MWNTFWPDVLVAFIGATLTVGIALATYFASTRLRETRALQSLIDDLHFRRTLSPIDVPRIVLNAEKLNDFEWTNKSVIEVKEVISRTRGVVQRKPNTLEILRKMTRACNRYLEESANSPEQYHFLLDELRNELGGLSTSLSKTRARLEDKHPGLGA